jgi:hypothetical protein
MLSISTISTLGAFADNLERGGDGDAFMYRSVVILASIIGVFAFVGGAAQSSEATRHQNEGKYQVAQACGWYAIYMCSRNAREAENWTYQREAIDSFTIHTSLAQYPNFAPGWFCAVDGPMDRTLAVAKARLMREYGTAPMAYAKNAC